MQNIHINGLFKSVFDAVLPPRCIVSGQCVVDCGTVSVDAWNSIYFISSPICKICGDSFEFGAKQGRASIVCTKCSKTPPSFKRARAAIAYDGAGRDIVLGFKHGDKTHMVKTFAPWMMLAGGDILPLCDFLVPVPLHGLRLIERRYNQSNIIAKEISKKSGIRCLSDALVRARYTKSQGHKNSIERAENVKDAFVASKKAPPILRGKSVCLIDDVITSGATANACASVLKSAGCKDVYVLTLARAIRV